MDSGYQEAREAAAFDERHDRGRVLLTGGDAQSFLHALVTNDIVSIQPGGAAYAALLTPQGRMITDMDVMVGEAGAVYLAVPSDAAAPLAARLDRSIFTEAVEVADVTASTAQFSVTGPRSRQAAEQAMQEAGPAAAGAAGIWARDALGLPGVDVIVPSAHAAAVRAAIASRAVPLSREAREILRVEAGRPEFHVDMTEETIPLEANLLARAISTTKGCYVGQEVIIRVLHRGGGRVAKKLVQLRFDGDVPGRGTPLSAEGKPDAGRVTSAVWSPRANAAIGLGYVHRDLAREGAALALPDGRTAMITSV